VTNFAQSNISPSAPILSKTNIVVNCPIVFTPEGGKLPGIEFERR
jgi:hypothetical protein